MFTLHKSAKPNFNMNIDFRKFKYSLVGDGYTLDEVEKLGESDLARILTDRIIKYVDNQYNLSRPIIIDALYASGRVELADDWTESYSIKSNKEEG